MAYSTFLRDDVYRPQYFDEETPNEVIKIEPRIYLSADLSGFETIQQQRDYVKSLPNATTTVILERKEGRDYKVLAEFSFDIPSSAFLEVDTDSPTFKGDPSSIKQEYIKPERSPYKYSWSGNGYYQFYTIPDDDVVTPRTHRVRLVDSYPGKKKLDDWYIDDNDWDSLTPEEREKLDEEFGAYIEDNSLFGSLEYPPEDTLTSYLVEYAETGKAKAPVIENKEYGTKKKDSLTGLFYTYDEYPTEAGYNDLMHGYEGNDKLIGKAGADYIVGGEGNDKLSGGDGDDILIGDEGNDKFYDGNGNDLMFGGSGKDKFKLGKGANVIMDFEKGDKLKIRGGVTWAQEDFGLLGTYKNGTLALIGDTSELIELVG